MLPIQLCAMPDPVSAPFWSLASRDEAEGGEIAFIENKTAQHLR